MASHYLCRIADSAPYQRHEAHKIANVSRKGYAELGKDCSIRNTCNEKKKIGNDVTSLSLGVNEFKSQIRHEKDTYPKLQFHCKLALVKRVVVDKSVVGNASD